VIQRLITRDPTSGAELIVTRLESPTTGVTIEGQFSLGWVGRLSPDQLELVGLLLRNRNNIQKVATDLGVAYNTVRNRFDDIVTAIGGSPDLEVESESRADGARGVDRDAVLKDLAAGRVSTDEAVRRLRGES
jgi:hypothetical protein